MKKFLSLAIAIIMILACLTACGKPATDNSEASAPESSVSESSASVPESSASVPESSSKESSASEASAKEPEEEPSYEAMKITTAPTIDGVITEEEWGAPFLSFDQNTERCYQDFHDGYVKLSATLWIRWDETYLYIGLTSPEPDGQYCSDIPGRSWDGDSLQIAIDPNGPNTTGDVMEPFTDRMINVSFSLITSTGEMCVYDHSAAVNADHSLTDAKFVYSLSDDNISTWEVAIKHSDICANYADRLAEIGEGFVYGISVVRLNAAPEDEAYNGWLSWGSGICWPRFEDDPGANKLVLTAAPAV